MPHSMPWFINPRQIIKEKIIVNQMLALLAAQAPAFQPMNGQNYGASAYRGSYGSTAGSFAPVQVCEAIWGQALAHCISTLVYGLHMITYTQI